MASPIRRNGMKFKSFNDFGITYAASKRTWHRKGRGRCGHSWCYGEEDCCESKRRQAARREIVRELDTEG